MRTILSIPFFHTILSDTILSVYHFVHTILPVPFCPLPFCPRTDVLMLYSMTAFSCCCHSECNRLGAEESDSTPHNFAPCQRKSNSTYQLVARKFLHLIDMQCLLIVFYTKVEKLKIHHNVPVTAAS